MMDRAELRHGLIEFRVPASLHDGLTEYFVARRPVGSFLTAVLANDLVDAVARADEMNALRLRAIVLFLLTYTDADAWGSRAKIADWLSGKTLPRR